MNNLCGNYCVYYMYVMNIGRKSPSGHPPFFINLPLEFTYYLT